MHRCIIVAHNVCTVSRSAGFSKSSLLRPCVTGAAKTLLMVFCQRRAHACVQNFQSVVPERHLLVAGSVRRDWQALSMFAMLIRSNVIPKQLRSTSAAATAPVRLTPRRHCCNKTQSQRMSTAQYVLVKDTTPVPCSSPADAWLKAAPRGRKCACFVTSNSALMLQLASSTDPADDLLCRSVYHCQNLAAEQSV